MSRKREGTTTKAPWTVETLENAVQNFDVVEDLQRRYRKRQNLTLKKRFRLAKSSNASSKARKTS
ncbi:hypothetical protein HHI36_004887, partial [Cryptolaemus montrouzieri]